MKWKISIVFSLVLVLLAACTPSKQTPESVEGPNPELSAIDSLMWRQPDCALAVLQQFAASPKADSLDELNGHYCQLLISELLYKNDYGQSNRPALQQTVRYFDSLCLCKGVARNISTISFLDARAHYINGVGYYERDSVVEACMEYLKALEVMEGHFVEKELVGERARFMALTFTHLTGLFSDFYLSEQAILWGKYALEYYRKYDATPWHIAWILVEIGSHYEMKRSYDNAYSYYEKAASAIMDTCSLMYRDIHTHKALIDYKTGKGSKISLTTLQNLIRNSKDEQEQLARYLIVGEIFYSEKQYDSAQVYLNAVFLNSQSVGAKKQAAEWLVNICETQGRISDIEEYADFLVPFANMNENQSTLKSQLTKLSHDFEQEKQEALHRNKTKTILKWSVVSMAVLIFIALMLFVFHFKDKKQQIQLKKQKYETEKQMEATVKEHLNELNEKDNAFNKAITEERKKAEYELRTKEMQHSAMLVRTRNRIVQLQEENKKLKDHKRQDDTVHESADNRKEPYEALTKEEIYRSIQQRMKKARIYTSFNVKDYASLTLTQKEMEQLITTINRHCPDFSKRLKLLYPKLNVNDLQLCRLFLLNLSVLQVAILLGTDYSSIRKRTNRLKEKIGSDELYWCLKSTLFLE